MRTHPTKAQLEGEIKALRRALELTQHMHAPNVIDRSILDAINVSYFELDLDGNFTDFNDNLCRDFGYNRQELIGMNYRVYTRSEFLASIKDFFEEIHRTGRTGVITNDRIVRKDGSFMVSEMAVSLKWGPSGEAIGFWGLGKDVTHQQGVIQALKESEEKYRAILENMDEAFLEIDLRGNLVFVNKAACTLLGYTREEMLGLNYRQYTAPERARQLYEIYHRIYETGKSEIITDHEVIRRDGALRTFELYVTPLRDQQGAPRGFSMLARDITERKQTEAALKKSEERYRSILESMQEAYYEVDLAGNFTFFNTTAVRGLGYRDDEMMGMSFRHYVDEENARRVFQVYHHVFLTGEPATGFEWELITKDGHTMHVESAVFLNRDAQGQPIGFRGIVRDIGARKQAEEALRQSEEKYRTILETMEESYFELDLKGNYTFFNEALCRDHGYSRAELMGMNYRVYTSPETAQQAFRVFNEIYRTGKGQHLYAHEIIRPDGSKRFIEMSLATLKDAAGTVIGFRGLGRDVTEKIKAQQALEESEGRFRDLANLLPESVFEFDENGRFTFVNQNAIERFGNLQADVDRGLNVMDVLVPEEYERALINALRVEKGEPLGLMEYIVQKKDGTRIPALVSTTAIYKDGRPAGRRGILIDISEKKNLEQQFLRAQKMEAIGTLAGGIAHDFNNLLMGILGNVSMLLMKMDETHPYYDRLKNVEEYVQRASDLTKQLLGFARGGKYEVRPTDLGAFTRQSSQMFSRTKKEIRVYHKAPPDLWTVDVDRGQMEQVLLNLFVNAWQAMPGGGDLYVSVDNIELDQEQVQPYGLQPGKFVRLSISDTGIGMDEATRARIFEPFFTTKELGRGTGLGLASVYGIIRNHGGFIGVESEQGVGTTFMIYLPASLKPVVTEPQTPSEVRQGQETVLLIDDEEMILDVGSQMLETLGYKVMTAAGGRWGLDIFDQYKDMIDLVILDMVMPDFGGKDVFETLMRSNAAVKILLSSGYSLDGQAKEILASGCKGFIQKPFNLAELSRKIREILDAQ